MLQKIKIKISGTEDNDKVSNAKSDSNISSVESENRAFGTENSCASRSKDDITSLSVDNLLIESIFNNAYNYFLIE